MTGASSPEIALHYDGSGQHLLRASAPLRLCVRLYWHCVSTGHDREIAPTGGCPSTVYDGPAVAPQRLRLPRAGEELPNYRDNCDNLEIGFACNVGFVLRFCALRPHVLRDRLFERVEPHPGFRARKANFAKLR